ncbi:MAG: HAD-IIIA family hydrolase [Oscillospiraceae bacterium]|nr:HAD-IIIA family hydrolase [Oscillospiraceae bacterium]
MKLLKPEMIIFDYGQTIGDETFNGIAGTKAMLEHAVRNKYDLTAEQVQAEADNINNELGRFDPDKRHLFQIEVPNDMFRNYLYESLGITLSVSGEQADTIFWDAAAPAKPTEGIQELLSYLKKKNIRTGVISNITYCSNAVKKRINTLLPENDFEFIIATSEYMFRKPNKRIFELALEKTELKAQQVWYCGDNFNCDIVGANNIGMLPVLYDGASSPKAVSAEFDFIHIHHWSDLIKILEDIG